MVFQAAVFQQEEAESKMHDKANEYRGVAQLVAARFGLGLQAPPVADSAQQGQAQRSLTSSDFFAMKEAGTARGQPKQGARKAESTP